MSITIITGPAKSGKTLIASALRNNKINQREGALLIDEHMDLQDIGPHIEKILVGATFPKDPPPSPAESWLDDGPNGKPLLPWKTNPTIIVTGDRAEDVLARLESVLPGLKKKFGPVYYVKLSTDGTNMTKTAGKK